MSDTKPLDVTQQVTQALSNKELLPKHEPLPKFVNESLKDIYKRMPGVSRGCANSIYLQGLREGLTESRKEVDRMRALLERAIAAIKAKDQLLGCYRVGREPSTKLWGELEKVVHLLSDYAAMKEGKE